MLTTEYRKLAWDTFLLDDVSKDTALSADSRDAVVTQRRSNIDSFRRVDWPNVRRQLNQDFNWELPEGLEPHWIDAGRAVMWQRQVIRQRVINDDGSRFLEDRDYGWHPTGAGLPLNNASQIAHYLDKGFRLRPPIDGVDEEAFEAAVPSEELRAEVKEKEVPDRVFKCSRHIRTRSDYVFKTWKGYVRHCYVYQEPIEEEMPLEMIESLSQYEYYCHACGKGFKNRVGAERHLQNEARKPGKRPHSQVADMEVASYANKS